MMSRFEFSFFSSGVTAVLAMFLLPGIDAHAGENQTDWQTPEPLRVSEPIFSEPHDVTLSPDGLYLFVADKGNNAVEILVPGALNSIGQLGPGTFNAPHDVAFDKKGLVYVADTANGRIAVWKFDGVTKYSGVLAEFVEEWSDGINWPKSIAIAPSGLAYVVDIRANALLVLENGIVTTRVTEAAGLMLDQPHDVEVDSHGKIYLTDPGNDRVLVFNPDLSLHRVLGAESYGFDELKYLGLDENDMLFVADEDNDRVRMMSSHDFKSVGDIGGDIAGQMLDRPKGIAVDGRYIWVSDTSNNRIILLRRKPQ